jgi:cytochrome c oxidase subunit 1
LLVVGQLIFVWNIVSSWLDGPAVENGDPWNLKEDDLYAREWHWFDRERVRALPDGGSDQDGSPNGNEPNR